MVEGVKVVVSEPTRVALLLPADEQNAHTLLASVNPEALHLGIVPAALPVAVRQGESSIEREPLRAPRGPHGMELGYQPGTPPGDNLDNLLAS